MKRTVYRISNLFEYAAGAVVMLMVVHICFDVLANYLLSSPIPGTEPVVANYYMVAVVYLPLAFVELRRESIAVDLFYQWFPIPMKKLATILGTVLSIVFFALLAYQSFNDAMRAYGTGEFVDGTYAVITWPSRFILPVSFVSVVIVLLMRLIHEFRHGDAPMTPPEKGLESESLADGA